MKPFRLARPTISVSTGRPNQKLVRRVLSSTECPKPIEVVGVHIRREDEESTRALGDTVGLLRGISQHKPNLAEWALWLALLPRPGPLRGVICS